MHGKIKEPIKGKEKLGFPKKLHTETKIKEPSKGKEKLGFPKKLHTETKLNVNLLF